jgi:prevent-host-death family protein
MMRVEMAEATASLGDYTKKARRGPVIVTQRGRPIAALTALDANDWEDLIVSTDPRFVALITRSRSLHKPGTGTPLEEIRVRYGLQATARRPTRRRSSRRRASSRTE